MAGQASRQSRRAVLELRHFRTFTAVVDAGSFHQAAARLHIAQPALSRQIRDLEEQLGVELLIRSARGVSMSPAGEAFYREARQVLMQVEIAGKQARRAAEGKFGALRVAYTSLVAEVRASVTAFAEIRREVPEVDWQLSMVNSDHQVDLILSGAIDVGVFYRRPPVPEELRYVDLRTDRYMLIVPDDHPLAKRRSVRLADLRDMPMLFASANTRPLTRKEMWSACIKAGFEPRIAMEVDNEVIGLNVVAAGIAVAFFNGSLAERRPEDGVTYLEIEDFEVPLHLAAVWRADRETDAIRMFVEILKRHLGPPAD